MLAPPHNSLKYLVCKGAALMFALKGLRATPFPEDVTFTYFRDNVELTSRKAECVTQGSIKEQNEMIYNYKRGFTK